jgi:antibiotic biosynthesis monooxygenase (ABM) superfamily enzyme
VIYPLTVLVPPIVYFFTAGVPVLMLPLVHRLIVAAIIVGLMTYVIMPRYTRLVARWLNR